MSLSTQRYAFPPEDWLLASWSASLSPAPHWLLYLQCWAFWVSLRHFHAVSLLLALLDLSFPSQHWKHRAESPTSKRPFEVFQRRIWVISLMIGFKTYYKYQRLRGTYKRQFELSEVILQMHRKFQILLSARRKNRKNLVKGWWQGGRKGWVMKVGSSWRPFSAPLTELSFKL